MNTMTTATSTKQRWTTLCNQTDLVPYSGVAALHNNEQIALFYLPGEENEVFALSNHDPVSNANVIARGLVGDIDGKLMVASPLYKQHYDLRSGECLDAGGNALKSWAVRLREGVVEVWSSQA